MRLEVSGVCYTYGKERVLDGVSFEAKENSIVSILGANGAGKTTLLKCLCNILRPSSGSITLDGQEMLALKGEALARRVGFVPQRVPVSAMTVFDAVLLGRKPHVKLAVTKKDLEIVSEILEAMGLTPLALRHLHQISGGEFQKVHIARALAQEPQILILDEPSNNLDMANQHKSLHLVEAIASIQKIGTIAFSTEKRVSCKCSSKNLRCVMSWAIPNTPKRAPSSARKETLVVSNSASCPSGKRSHSSLTCAFPEAITLASCVRIA